MPIEHTSWALPAIKEAYDHRQQILSVWDTLIAHLLGKKSKIAVTGMPGAGKSVLLEHLTGEAFVLGHPLPLQPSPSEEEGRIVAHKKRIRLVTIPGQETNARYKSAIAAFEGKQPLSGVIHVVANGYSSVRGKAAQNALRNDFGLGTWQDYRTYMLAQELEDLKRTCSFVERSFLKHHAPMWMLIVSSKCDLYEGSLDKVEEYYSPSGKNRFVEELDKLVGTVGSLHFTWDSAPACATLEDMDWNGQRVFSTLKVSQRDQLITLLLSRIERYCASK